MPPRGYVSEKSQVSKSSVLSRVKIGPTCRRCICVVPWMVNCDVCTLFSMRYTEQILHGLRPVVYAWAQRPARRRCSGDAGNDIVVTFNTGVDVGL